MDYRPISCEFHDDLESYAVTGRRVRILHTPAEAAGAPAEAAGAPDEAAGTENGPGEPIRSEGRIRDIHTTQQKEEFLTLYDGTSIRLDRIRSVEALAVEI